jgi:hypothetical protein
LELLLVAKVWFDSYSQVGICVGGVEHDQQLAAAVTANETILSVRGVESRHRAGPEDR